MNNDSGTRSGPRSGTGTRNINRNRLLNIYSDLARYTCMNQMQTNETLQRIESGIRELNRFDSPRYSENTNRHPYNHNPGSNTMNHNDNNTWQQQEQEQGQYGMYMNSNDNSLNSPNSPNIRNLFNNNTSPDVRNLFNITRPNVSTSTTPNVRRTMNNRMSNNTRGSSQNNRMPTIFNSRPNANTRINQPSNHEFLTQYANMFNTDLNNLTPVIVRPTSFQITNSTEIININDIETNTICPILQTPFQDGDRITRIKQCGHCFIEDGLLSWFNRSVVCPVCRYDIRDYPTQNNNIDATDTSNNNIDTSNTDESNTSNNNNNDDASNNTIDNLLNQFAYQIIEPFQQYMPYMPYNDASFNNVNNGEFSIDYIIQTPTNLYTTNASSSLFGDNIRHQLNEDGYGDDVEVEVEDEVEDDEDDEDEDDDDEDHP